MENKLTLPSDADRQSEMMDLETTSNVQTDPKGKKKIGQDPMITTTTRPSVMKIKLFKDPLQIVDYPTPTMDTTIKEGSSTNRDTKYKIHCRDHQR